MRTLILIVATLAGYSVAAANVAAAEPKPGTAVAFFANSDAEYRDAVQRATEWCAEKFGTPAQYLDSRIDSGGKVVRFGCVLNQSAARPTSRPTPAQ
jgi:hypothetical protein